MDKKNFESLQRGLEEATESIENNYRGCIIHTSEDDYIKKFDKYIEYDATFVIHRKDGHKVVVMPFELYQDLRNKAGINLGKLD